MNENLFLTKFIDLYMFLIKKTTPSRVVVKHIVCNVNVEQCTSNTLTCDRKFKVQQPQTNTLSNFEHRYKRFKVANNVLNK